MQRAWSKPMFDGTSWSEAMRSPALRSAGRSAYHLPMRLQPDTAPSPIESPDRQEGPHVPASVAADQGPSAVSAAPYGVVPPASLERTTGTGRITIGTRGVRELYQEGSVRLRLANSG